MAAVTLSSRFQVVVPKEIRERFRLKPGQKISIFEWDGRIYMLPVLPYEQMLGMMPDLPPSGYREKVDLD